MKMTISNSKKAPLKKAQDLIHLICDKLNSLVNSNTDFFKISKEGSSSSYVINFHSCANTKLHSKLIGLLLCFFSQDCNFDLNFGYIGIGNYGNTNDTGGAIFINDPQALYDFLNQIDDMENVQISLE